MELSSYPRFQEELYKMKVILLGERRGLVVITEDCHSKGRGIESRSYLQQTGAKKCESEKWNRWSISREERRERRIKEEGPAGVSGMDTRIGLVCFEKTLKWSTPSKD